MKMQKRQSRVNYDSYLHTIEKFVERVKANLAERVKSLTLFGSMVARDVVSGLSDLDDFILVLKGNQVDLNLLESLSEIGKEVGNMYGLSYLFGFDVFTEEQIPIGGLECVPATWNYLVIVGAWFQRKVLIGEDVLANSNIPLESLKLFAKNWLEFKIFDNINDLIAGGLKSSIEVEWTYHFAREAILFSQLALLYKGIAVMRKEEVVSRFYEAYPELDEKEVLLRSLDLRSRLAEETKEGTLRLRDLVDKYRREQREATIRLYYDTLDLLKRLEESI